MMTKVSQVLSLAVVALLVVVGLPIATQAATCASSQTVSVSSSATSVSVCAGQTVYIKVGTTTANFKVSSVGTSSMSITTAGSPSRATISVGSSLNVVYPEKFETRMTLSGVRNGNAVISLSATHLAPQTGGTPIAGFSPDLVASAIQLNAVNPYNLAGGNILKISYTNNGAEAVTKPFSLTVKFSPSWVTSLLGQPLPYFVDSQANGSTSFISAVDKGNGTYEVSPNKNASNGLNAYALSPGQSGEMHIVFPEYYGQLIPNGMTLTVTADSNNTVAESNEANNASSNFYPTTKGYDGSGNYVYMSTVKMIPGTNKV